MLYTFEKFTLNLDTLELLCGDRQVVLQRLPLDLLLYLIERRERVVTKDELLEQVWKGISVGEGALTQAIAVVRRALGERHAPAPLIQTVRGRGYRFGAPVREIATHGGLAQGPASRPGAPGSDRGPFVGRHELMRLIETIL